MRKWILPGILLLAFLVRIVGLDQYPHGFTPDEASFGYDAYSILKTGADQWGHRFPLVLESFGDYKSPLYSYLLIPFVYLFGLTRVVVRLPNALIGTFAVLATYLLTYELTKKKIVSYISAFLLSISSWHIMMSRGAFEANLTTLFLPLGIFLVHRGIKKNILMYLGAIVLGLNLFTYHSAKFVTPIILAIYAVIFWKDLISAGKKTLVISASIFLFFSILTGYTFAIGAGTRAMDVNIYKGSLEEAAAKRMDIQASGVSPFVAKILINKYTVFAKRFTNNYFSYLSPKFLFVDGPAEYTYGMLPGTGVLYYFEIPFLIMFILLFGKSENRKVLYFILAWLLIAPIPASMATGPGFAGNRALIMVPGIYLALALGAGEVLDKLKNKIFISAYFVLIAVSFLSFLTKYFVFSPALASKGMLFGNLEVSNYLAKNISSEQKVIFDKSLSEPHIYVAFANKMDPSEYQNQTKSWKYKESGLGWVDQLPEYVLGNYTFKRVNYEEYKNKAHPYLVSDLEAFPENFDLMTTIFYPNGNAAVKIANPSE